MEKIINHRLYLSGIPSNNDRGIACYNKCLGAFFKCFGFASKFKCGGRIYYVNKKSFKKYHFPVSQNIPIPSRLKLTPSTAKTAQPSVIKKLFESMSEDEIKDYVKLNLSVFASARNIHAELFTYLISNLDTQRAGFLIMGLWENAELNMGLKVESLRLIYDTLKGSQGVNYYSNQFHSCMSSILFHLQTSKSWETFLSKTILAYDDGKDGPNNHAFEALMHIAVLHGVTQESVRPQLMPLLKDHKELFVFNKGIHPTLEAELDPHKRDALIKLARASSL